MTPKLPPTPIDVASILQKIAGYKGLPFPGVFVPWLGGSGASVDKGGDYKDGTRQKLSSKGTAIYKIGEKGTYYFMPVKIGRAHV